MKRRVLSLALALCVTASLLVVPAAAAGTGGFSDVTDSETAVAVECLRLMGVLDGYGDGTFRPGVTLNRAQFCKMAVYAMNGASELGKYRVVTVYPDVKPSYWAAPYINLASKGKQVILGFADGSFHPEAALTVGQAVTILMRMLGYQDGDVGAVWPDGYMAQAETVGLLDGLSLSSSAALNRGQAARLFVNLLRTDMKEGGKSFGESVAASAQTHVMLVSSTATGSDGQAASMEIGGTGQTYRMANKVSNGLLNGRMGTLLLDQNGRVLTFVPETAGSTKLAVVVEATSSRLAVSSGESYSMTGDVKAHYQGEEKSWSDVFQWLTAGTSVTLYLGATGGVEYVFVGGSGSAVNQAVVVQESGSVAGFSSLTGGATGYRLMKNGGAASASDMRPYDVAIYSSATNTVRVTDLRITGVYESCFPNPDAPETVTALGHTFTVLPSARESLKNFKVGKTFTLLLTEDNQVAGAVKADESAARGNAVGILESKGTVRLLNGLTLEGAVSGSIGTLVGQLVRVSSGKTGVLTVSLLSGGATGELDVAARTVGRKALASNALIFRATADGVEAITLADVETATVREGQIRYARSNWKDQIDLLVLGDKKITTEYVYGRVKASSEDGEWVWKSGCGENEPKNPGVNGEWKQPEDEHGNPDGDRYWVWNPGYGPQADRIPGVNGDYEEEVHATVQYGEGKSVGPFLCLFNVGTGDYVKASVNSDGTRFTSMVRLTEVKNVSNSAWAGRNAVTVGARTYTVADGVPCYNASSGRWVSLDTAHAFAGTCTLYVEGSAVRVIEVEQ